MMTMYVPTHVWLCVCESPLQPYQDAGSNVTGAPNAKISIAPGEGSENLVWHLVSGERKFASRRWRGAKI